MCTFILHMGDQRTVRVQNAHSYIVYIMGRLYSSNTNNYEQKLCVRVSECIMRATLNVCSSYENVPCTT